MVKLGIHQTFANVRRLMREYLLVKRVCRVSMENKRLWNTIVRIYIIDSKSDARRNWKIEF